MLRSMLSLESLTIGKKYPELFQTGETIGGRPIMVRRLPIAARDADCKIMFIAGSHAQSVHDALKTVRGAPILTVTDEQANGGVVDFIIDQGRVHFRIDDQGYSSKCGEPREFRHQRGTHHPLGIVRHHETGQLP